MMKPLLRVIRAPIIVPVEASFVQQHGCSVSHCKCDSFTLNESHRYALIPVSAECVCGHALMYHAKRERNVAPAPYCTVAAEPSPRQEDPVARITATTGQTGQGSMEAALEHAHQADRVVQMKLSKYRHTCNAPDSTDASKAHAVHTLQEAFRISLRSLEEIGEARTQLTDDSERSALLRHESMSVMRRLMESCEYAQRELAAHNQVNTPHNRQQHHQQQQLTLCPNCEEVLNPKLGKYCANCGY
jgi:hypothetical protein